MEVTAEEENFINIARILLEIVPQCLRKLFVDQWNKKYPNQFWQSDGKNENIVLGELPNDIKNDKRYDVYIDNMRTGNEKDWDTSTLLFALLFSKLKLIPGCRPKSQRIIPLRTSEEIDIIREARNFFFEIPSMQCPHATFAIIVSKIKGVARIVFGVDAENAIYYMEKSQLNVKMTEQLKHQLDSEKKRNHELEKVIRGKQLCMML